MEQNEYFGIPAWPRDLWWRHVKTTKCGEMIIRFSFITWVGYLAISPQAILIKTKMFSRSLNEYFIKKKKKGKKCTQAYKIHTLNKLFLSRILPSSNGNHKEINLFLRVENNNDLVFLMERYIKLYNSFAPRPSWIKFSGAQTLSFG